jgi:hypothetical protein
MNAFRVESKQHFHKIIDIHCSSPFLFEINRLEDFLNSFFHIQVLWYGFVFQATLDLKVLFKHHENGRLGKDSTKSFIFSHKSDTS